MITSNGEQRNRPKSDFFLFASLVFLSLCHFRLRHFTRNFSPPGVRDFHLISLPLSFSVYLVYANYCNVVLYSFVFWQALACGCDFLELFRATRKLFILAYFMHGARRKQRAIKSSQTTKLHSSLYLTLFSRFAHAAKNKTRNSTEIECISPNCNSTRKRKKRRNLKYFRCLIALARCMQTKAENFCTVLHTKIQ